MTGIYVSLDNLRSDDTMRHDEIYRVEGKHKMSALKKQSSLRWAHSNELTPGGAIVCTNWTATVGRFSLTVTNYPGTKTLEWEMVIPGTDWRNGGVVDRFEYTVSTLKDFVLEKALGMASLGIT